MTPCRDGADDDSRWFIWAIMSCSINSRVIPEPGLTVTNSYLTLSYMYVLIAIPNTS